MCMKLTMATMTLTPAKTGTMKKQLEDILLAIDIMSLMSPSFLAFSIRKESTSLYTSSRFQSSQQSNC